MDCAKLLIDMGADINASNSWKTTPLTISLLRGHVGCANMLLDLPNISIDCYGEEGESLLSIAIKSMSDQMEKLVKKLLQKGADPTHADYKKNTPLHEVAQITKGLESAEKRILGVAKQLLDKGASCTALNNNGHSPFKLVLNQDSTFLLDLFQSTSLNNNPHILHEVASHILNKDYQNLILNMITNSKPTHQTINCLDANGFNPFLKYIVALIEDIDVKRKLEQILRYFTRKQGKNFMKFVVDSSQVLNPFPFNYIPSNQSREGEVTAEQFKEAVEQKYKEIIFEPFFKFLAQLVKHGADPNAQVQQLKHMRDLEEKIHEITRNKKLTANERKEAIDMLKHKLKKELMTQEVTLMLRYNHGKRQDNEKLLAKIEKAKFRKLPLKFTDVEKYDRVHGKANALHIAFHRTDILEKLQIWNIQPNVQNLQGKTPLHLLSEVDRDQFQTDYETFFAFFTKDKSLIDLPDKFGVTPFLNFIEKRNSEYALKLLDMKANVNVMDNKGMTALKHLVFQQNRQLLQRLVTERKADVNIVDQKGRNLLHHALIYSDARKESTFLIENLLIDLGVDKNQLDSRGRVPLHYAFVKPGNWDDTSTIDPIEQVSGLCAYSDLAVNVADHWKKTPLHYAAQRGSTISAMYLAKRKAHFESQDTYNNTPLCIAVNYSQFNFAAMLTTFHADASKQVHKADLKEIKQAQPAEEREERMTDGENDTIPDIDSPCPASQFQNLSMVLYQWNKVLGHMKNQSETKNVFSEDSSSSEESESDESTSSSEEESESSEESSQVEEQDKKWPKSIFKLAISKAQFGLAYLALDQGYSYMKAISDSIEEHKFKLALSLLSKEQNKKVIQQQTSDGETLGHVLARNIANCPKDIEHELFSMLVQKGVNIHAKDKQGRTALHYAAQNGSQNVVEILMEKGARISEIDKSGHSPFSLYVSNHYKSLWDEEVPIFEFLQKGNINTVFPDSSHSPAFKKSDVGTKYDEETHYSTPVICALRQLAGCPDFDYEKIEATLDLFLRHGASLVDVDSDGRDALYYAIIENHTELAELLLESNKLDKKIKDLVQMTPVHMVARPHELGSYDNAELLKALHKHGYSLSDVDKFGKRPIDYAAHGAGDLYDWLQANTKGKHPSYGMQLAVQTKWTAPKFDFAADASKFLAQASKNKQEKQAEEKALVPVDSTGNFGKQYEVYKEGDKYWDVYLTKVDLYNGFYGKYVFYKIQLLYDTARDLYLVFTRWGRIGESGKNQRTPFSKVEEAKKDFCHIFKSKTMNDYMDLDNFERAKKKYNLAQVNYCVENHRDYLKPFHFGGAPSSKLESSIKKLFYELSNVSAYVKALQQMSLDKDRLPFSGLQKSALEKAKSILFKIKSKIAEEDKEKEQKKTNFDKIKLIREEIGELSSLYYEIIPLTQFKDQIPTPIQNEYQLNDAFKVIHDLLDIQQASQILLGAHQRTKQISPLDYIFDALQVKMQILDSEDAQYKLIKQYVCNSYKLTQNEQLKVYSVERRGEAERFGKFQPQYPRRLLFHGSSMVNFISILSQGLKIAPQGVQQSGSRFGKGIYFADQFSKAKAYGNCETGKTQAMVLLCDVILGDIQYLYQNDKVKETKFDTVWAAGCNGPDYERSLFLNTGSEMPISKVCDYQNFDNRAVCYENEFVVHDEAQVQIKYLIQITK